MEIGWTCAGGSPTSEDTCNQICGDGIEFPLYFPWTDYCDDENLLNGDGCSSTCHVETGFTCSGGSPTSEDVCKEICGDGKNFGFYQCDDSNTVSGDGCSSTCGIEVHWVCTGGSSTTADVCTDFCGDGFVVPGMPPTYCDDGNTDNWDGCSNTCQVELSASCGQGYFLNDQEVCQEICGDGLDFGWYECDDCNTASGDGCSASCVIETGYTCNGGTSSSPDTCVEICGDGLNFGHWSCDDGNEANNDGCSDECSTETGWSCTGGSSSSPDVCTPVCGDKLIVHLEECDDGNTANGDG